MEIGDVFDANWFRMEDVEDVVSDYVEAAATLGYREVRILHGKRTGDRRLRVRAALSTHPVVLRFADAPKTRGGLGGTLVWLTGTKVPPK